MWAFTDRVVGSRLSAEQAGWVATDALPTYARSLYSFGLKYLAHIPFAVGCPLLDGSASRTHGAAEAALLAELPRSTVSWASGCPAPILHGRIASPGTTPVAASVLRPRHLAEKRKAPARREEPASDQPGRAPHPELEGSGAVSSSSSGIPDALPYLGEQSDWREFRCAPGASP